MKELDLQLDLAEKAFRIEKRFCDFWFDVSKDIVRKSANSEAIFFVHLAFSESLIDDKGMMKIYAKLNEELSLGPEPHEKVTLHFIECFKDHLTIRKASNSSTPLLTLPYTHMLSFDIFKSILSIRLSLNLSDLPNPSTDPSNPSLPSNLYLFFDDPASLSKTLSVLTVFLPPTLVLYQDMGDNFIDKKVSLYAANADTFTLGPLEGLLSNSEYVLNPMEEDRLDLFEMIHQDRGRVRGEMGGLRKGGK